MFRIDNINNYEIGMIKKIVNTLFKNQEWSRL